MGCLLWNHLIWVTFKYKIFKLILFLDFGVAAVSYHSALILWQIINMTVLNVMLDLERKESENFLHQWMPLIHEIGGGSPGVARPP